MCAYLFIFYSFYTYFLCTPRVYIYVYIYIYIYIFTYGIYQISNQNYQPGDYKMCEIIILTCRTKNIFKAILCKVKNV